MEWATNPTGWLDGDLPAAGAVHSAKGLFCKNEIRFRIVWGQYACMGMRLVLRMLYLRRLRRSGGDSLLPLTLLFLLLPPLTVQSCSKYFANIWKLQVARSNHYSCKSCQDLQHEHAHCLCEVSTSWDVLPKVHELICHLGPWANYWAISSLQNC